MQKANSLSKTIKLSTLSVIILSILVLISSLNTSPITEIKTLGFLALALLLTISWFVWIFFMIKTHTIPKIIANFLVLFIMLLLVYSLALIIDDFSLRGIIVFIELLLVLSFFIFMSFVMWNKRKIGIIANIIAVFLLLNFIFFAVKGFSLPFKSFAGNINVFSALMFFLAFFPLLYYRLINSKLNKMFWSMIIGINLILIIVGQARSIWLALLVCSFVFLFWNRISSHKFVFYSFFWLVTIILITIPIIYPLLSTHPDAWLWNQYVRQYTGANFFSGRERFWLLLIELIKQKPFLGYGASAVPGNFMPITLSSHNYYLQIALQTGLTGLCLILMLFFNIWKVFYYGKNNIYVRLTGSFFIASLIYQSFEVSLTQNNVAVGMLMWLIMAIGVSKSKEEKNKTFFEEEKL